MAWGECHTKAEIQQLAYDTIREQTDLCSQHAILATHRAAEAITGCRKRREKGASVSKPSFTAPTVPYDARTMTLFNDDTVSLSTIERRVRAQLKLPRGDNGYQNRFLDSDEWDTTESTLTSRNGFFFLHLGFRRSKPETDSQPTDAQRILGVDLGVDNLAVTSTALFINGGKFGHRLRNFERVRMDLQRAGTRSSRRTLGRVSGQQSRFVRDTPHNASKAIVEEATRYKCTVIAFEDLTDIRHRLDASWGHTWPFRTIHQQVKYKAEAAGIDVTQVESKETSIQCADCGYTDPENRVSRDRFRCGQCSSEANADYNAAKNIGMRYVREGQQSPSRTGKGQLALKSGTVTPSGEFRSYPDGFPAEFTDKSHPEKARSSD